MMSFLCAQFCRPEYLRRALVARQFCVQPWKNGSVTFQKIGPSIEPFSQLQYADTLDRLYVRVGEEAHEAHLPERLSPGLCGYM
jgi:hypothetical protein